MTKTLKNHFKTNYFEGSLKLTFDGVFITNSHLLLVHFQEDFVPGRQVLVDCYHQSVYPDNRLERHIWLYYIQLLFLKIKTKDRLHLSYMNDIHPHNI